MCSLMMNSIRGETDPVVGEGGVAEREVGVAQDQLDLGLGSGQLTEVMAFDVEGDLAGENGADARLRHS